MAVWPVLKFGTEMMEKLEPVLDCLGTVWVDCLIIYAINYGLCVVGPEMAMDCVITDARREGCPQTAHYSN